MQRLSKVNPITIFIKNNKNFVNNTIKKSQEFNSYNIFNKEFINNIVDKYNELNTNNDNDLNKDILKLSITQVNSEMNQYKFKFFVEKFQSKLSQYIKNIGQNDKNIILICCCDELSDYIYHNRYRQNLNIINKMNNIITDIITDYNNNYLMDTFDKINKNNEVFKLFLPYLPDIIDVEMDNTNKNTNEDINDNKDIQNPYGDFSQEELNELNNNDENIDENIDNNEDIDNNTENKSNNNPNMDNYDNDIKNKNLKYTLDNNDKINEALNELIKNMKDNNIYINIRNNLIHSKLNHLCLTKTASETGLWKLLTDLNFNKQWISSLTSNNGIIATYYEGDITENGLQQNGLYDYILYYDAPITANINHRLIKTSDETTKQLFLPQPNNYYAILNEALNYNTKTDANNIESANPFIKKFTNFESAQKYILSQKPDIIERDGQGLSNDKTWNEYNKKIYEKYNKLLQNSNVDNTINNYDITIDYTDNTKANEIYNKWYNKYKNLFI